MQRKSTPLNTNPLLRGLFVNAGLSTVMADLWDMEQKAAEADRREQAHAAALAASQLSLPL